MPGSAEPTQAPRLGSRSGVLNPTGACHPAWPSGRGILCSSPWPKNGRLTATSAENCSHATAESRPSLAPLSPRARRASQVEERPPFAEEVAAFLRPVPEHEAFEYRFPLLQWEGPHVLPAYVRGSTIPLTLGASDFAFSSASFISAEFTAIVVLRSVTPPPPAATASAASIAFSSGASAMVRKSYSPNVM